MKHHHLALAVVGAALVLDTGLGLGYGAAEHIGPWHGLYCALATAVTVGGDVAPYNVAGYVIMTAICITVVPLFGAAFSLFTSALSSVHLRPVHAKLARLAGEEDRPCP